MKRLFRSYHNLFKFLVFYLEIVFIASTLGIICNMNIFSSSCFCLNCKLTGLVLCAAPGASNLNYLHFSTSAPVVDILHELCDDLKNLENLWNLVWCSWNQGYKYKLLVKIFWHNFVFELQSSNYGNCASEDYECNWNSLNFIQI